MAGDVLTKKMKKKKKKCFEVLTNFLNEVQYICFSAAPEIRVFEI